MYWRRISSCAMFSSCRLSRSSLYAFFFNDTATTEIYTLSLHDALPILAVAARAFDVEAAGGIDHRKIHVEDLVARVPRGDRKSTRLNSSHANISYAVFCLKKKKQQKPQHSRSRRPRLQFLHEHRLHLRH